MRWMLGVGSVLGSADMAVSWGFGRRSPRASMKAVRQSGARLLRAGEERLEAAATVERDELITAADVDVVDLLDPALLEERLGAQAIRARRRAVHLDGWHRRCRLGGLLGRQVRRAPRRQSAGERGRVLEAELLQHRDGARRARAGRADDDDRQRLVL